MRQFKIKLAKYIIPPEYKSTREYKLLVNIINIWKQQRNNSKELYLCGFQLKLLPRLPYNLRKLNCSINHLTSLPPLPNNLRELNCRYNKLTNLPTLPKNLEKLDCGNNKLISLPSLPNSLYRLQCGNNPLTSLPTLSNTLPYHVII
jgi:hypothetical protein